MPQQRRRVATLVLGLLSLASPAWALGPTVRFELGSAEGLPAGGPYVGACVGDGGTVSWLQPSATPSTLVLRGLDGRELLRQVAPAAERIRARVRGLPLGARVNYEVLDAQGQSLGGGQLSTALPPGRPMRVAVVGDTGGATPGQQAVASAMAAWQPDFVLHLGDIIYERGEAAQYGPRYLKPYGPMIARVPVYPSPGNHDLLTGGGAPYDAFFDWPGRGAGPRPARWYSFKQGDATFVALDSNAPFGAGTPQEAFLRRSLDAARDSVWRFAFFHHPPYSGGSHGSSHALRRAWSPTFEEKDVQLVLTGHDHHYERTTPREDHVRDGRPTTYLVSGGGGAWLRRHRAQPFTAVGLSAHHFVALEIHRQALRGQALSPDGRVLDRFELRP